MKKVDIRAELTKTTKKIKHATVNDTVLVLGVLLFMVAGFMVIVAMAVFIGSFIPRTDHIKLGYYIGFHYVFFTVVGLSMIRYSSLGRGDKGKRESNVGVFLNLSTLSLGIVLLILSCLLTICHIFVSVVTSVYNVEYVVELFSYM